MPLTKPQVAAHLARKTGIKRKTAFRFLNELAALYYIEAPNTFKIPGIGKLTVIDRKPRICRNPATGEKITVPARKAIKFSVAYGYRKAVLS